MTERKKDNLIFSLISAGFTPDQAIDHVEQYPSAAQNLSKHIDDTTHEESQTII